MGDLINGINREAEAHIRAHRRKDEEDELRAHLCGEFGRPAPILELPARAAS